MTNKYNHIIWDWNGTLLNDVELGVKIANTMLENHTHHQLSVADYQAAFGFPITTYYTKIGIDLEKESFEELTDKFVTLYNSQVGTCQLHEAVPSILTSFKEKGIHQHILTAAHLDMVLPLLDAFSITDYFRQIEGVNNFKAQGKVQRGIALMKANQFNKEKTVLIGDTFHDYEVADAMGIDCVLVAIGHQSKERLIANSGVDTIVIDDIRAVVALV